jgi:uncharacterized protein (TIGR03000 family)
MFDTARSFARALFLAGASVLLVPGLGQAQHGGGGHGGGGHFGGGAAHFGSGGAHFTGRGGQGHFASAGAHFAGGGGRFPAGDFGRFRAGTHPGGTRLGGPLNGGGHYRPYFGGYGYNPNYGLYDGYYPYYNGTSNYDETSSPTYDWGDYSSYGEVAPDLGAAADSAAPAVGGYLAPYLSSTATTGPVTTAHLTVTVPADAQLSFNGTPIAAAGTLRQFDSPPLAAGKYSYDVLARWTENGREVTETQQVVVTAGARVELVFPAQSKTRAVTSD